MTIRADLHIHSCLSPCGSLLNSPIEIARNAKARNLDLIALTDHNTSLNCPAFLEACDKVGISGICGMEASTAEEAHCLCLFPNLETALEYSEFIYSHLQKMKHDPERLGDQVIVDVDENVTGTVEAFLIAATDLSLEVMCDEVQRRGGLFIPAHVDRSAYSLTSQLGFIPPGNYDGLEWYRPSNPLIVDYPAYRPVFNSDAHYPEHIAHRITEFPGVRPGFDALKTWLHKR